MDTKQYNNKTKVTKIPQEERLNWGFKNFYASFEKKGLLMLVQNQE